jgi:bifunctional DNA-binding transcriptional regulator/antitoxin component of YhaV-PrlF toxin-antitoxin module
MRILYGEIVKFHVFKFKYGGSMSYIATVTSKSMVTIPSGIRKKYKIREGMKIKFVETEIGVLMIPLPKLEELRGIDRQHADGIIEAIKELELEHREESQK